MAEANEETGEWQVLEGVDPTGAEFPVETTLDDEDILVVKTVHGFRGVQALCPHQAVPLLKATLMSNETMIRCPRHNFIFRLDNGDGVNCRGMDMQVYEIREVNGRLEGLIPD